MKTAKYLVTPLVMASAFAMAAIPPYHAEGNITGTATFRAEGSCSVDAQTFPGARFGSVFDSANEAEGLGLVSADGQLLALVDENGPPLAVVKLWQSTADASFVASGFVNMAGDNLYSYLQAQSGCVITTAMPVIKSTFTLSFDGVKESLVLDAAFVGYTDYAGDCKVHSDGTVCRARKFSGSIGFSSDP